MCLGSCTRDQATSICRQELQSDVAPKIQVLGFVDHAHATPTQLAEHAVVGDRSADHDLPPARMVVRNAMAVNWKGLCSLSVSEPVSAFRSQLRIRCGT